MKLLECHPLPEDEASASLMFVGPAAVDAALVGAAEEVTRLWARCNEPSRSDDEVGALIKALGAAYERLSTPARTLAGLAVKAHHVMRAATEEDSPDRWLGALAKSLVADIDRLAHISGSESDCALVTLFKEWAPAISAAWAPKGRERERVRNERRASKLAREIAAAPAFGPLGLAIKLHVAWQAHHGSVCDGSADITEPHEAERGSDGNWCQRDALHWSAIKDATRLAGLQDLLSICGDAPPPPAPPARLSPRELLWSALLHVSPGWVERENHVEVEIEEGRPERTLVPIVPGAPEITPDTTSPLWPAALAELTAARERYLARSGDQTEQEVE